MSSPEHSYPHEPDARPLAALIGPPLAPQRFLELALAICAAVQELHRHNINHNNLNPHTIAVREHPLSATLIGSPQRSPLPYRYPHSPPPAQEVMPPYMSPEQTGRLNLSLDQRSDLYALGVIFYQMLTGKLPFQANDLLGWVHCHIAQVPAAPEQLVPGIPRPLSDLVLKLLAKNPDHRYQSTTGLVADLERCLAHWREKGEIPPFALGEQDISERLLIPQKLYGREQEKASLLASLDRVAQTGTPEVVMVAGYAGIGKSTLVRALYRPSFDRQALWGSGKCDRLKRNVPYAAAACAFRDLMHQLLTQSEEQIARWRTLMREALGNNGDLMVQIIPEMELIVGPQPAVPELPPAEARNRFYLTLRDLLQVFARKEHPLVLFFDDLQWADAPSLQLIGNLFGSSGIEYILCIGTYRDNEVGAGHPLRRTLEEMERAGQKVATLTLAPLSLEDVTSFVSDALGADPERCRPLARLVQEKTGSNPFFVTQFLLSLYQEGLLELDRDQHRWKWNLDRIREKGYTDNVVDLMVEKLKKLSESALQALKVAACFGNRIDRDTFTVISGIQPDQAAETLSEAVREGLLTTTDGDYAFRHDRIHEAAYSLVPQQERPSLHLTIGTLLLAHLDAPEANQERLFEVVNQLNRGVALIGDAQQRQTLCRLNHLAGVKAKRSLAYASALGYLAQAAQLLSADAWSADYRETLALHLDRSECAFLVGNFAQAEEIFRLLLDHAASDLDRAEIYRLKSRLLQVQGEFAPALRVTREALALVGITLPEPEQALGEAMEEELALIDKELSRIPLSQRREAPPPSDSREALVITLLTEALGPAYATSSPYFSLCAAKAVSHSLRFGTSADSCFAYSAFALALIALYGKVATAFEFSQTALALVERFGNQRVKGQVLAAHGGLVLPWRRHIALGLPMLQRALAYLLEAGDFVAGGYLTPLALWGVLESGEQLVEVRKKAQEYLSLNRQMHNQAGYQTVLVLRQLVASLQGETREPASFDDDSFNEAACHEQFTRTSWHAGLAYFEVSKLLALLLYGRYREAVEAGERAEPLLRLMMAMPVAASLTFYMALATSMVPPRHTPEPQNGPPLEALLERVKRWAENCPENFGSRYALVAAQLASLRGEVLEAERLYEKAIDAAKENGLILIEALSLELAARFYRDRGFDRFASGYVRRACALYAQWGGAGKVRQLEQLHPFLLEPEQTYAVGIDARMHGIDSIAVAKASQAISGEIELDRLTATLMQIVMENAGARKAVLFLARGEELTPQAQAVQENHAAATSRPPSPGPDLAPQSVVDYVKRTRERVILENACEENMFSWDPYLARNRPISLLCLPILRQSHLTGLLYLENNLVRGTFTAQRVAVLEVLAGQAAISIDNARLYAEMQQENRERRAAEERFRDLLESAPDAMVISDGEGKISLVNSQAEQLFGYQRSELYGQSIEILIPPRFRDRHIQHRMDYGLSPKLRPMGAGLELFAQRRDGSEFPVAISLSPLRTGEGLVIMAAVRDITERKQAEVKLRESEKRYRQLNETLEQRIEQAVEELRQKNRLLMVQSRQAVMGEMISNIAHQWRQPLNTLGLLAQELQMTYRSGELSQEFIEGSIKKTLEIIRHMSKTIDDFRNFFRSGKEKEEFRARDILERTISLIEASLATQNIRIEIDTAGDPTIFGYPNEFSQVLLNILNNARDAFAAQNTTAPLISIRLYSEGEKTVLTITDNAGGVPDEIIDRIFEPYFTTKGPEQGTGIGLFMCKTIIEKNMNGAIGVRNTESGAQFRIELPAAPLHATPASESTVPQG